MQNDDMLPVLARIAEAREWARSHDDFSGRVAWQYIVNLAGSLSKTLR